MRGELKQRPGKSDRFRRDFSRNQDDTCGGKGLEGAIVSKECRLEREREREMYTIVLG